MKKIIENSPDLLLFTHLVEYKSFTALADRLDMNKSVISKRIRNLENQLQAQLLIRSTRNLELTEAGKLLYDRCRNLHEDFHEIYSEISDLSKMPQGTLRIGGSSNFAKEHLAPLIVSFLREHTQINFELMTGRAYQDIIKNRIDLGFHIGPLPDSTLIARKLTTRIIGACASPEYLAKHGTPKTPQELENHNCLAFANGHRALPWRFKDKDNNKIDIQVSGNFVATSTQVLKTAALNHLGVFYVSGNSITNELRRNQLQWILQDYTLDTVDIYALYPQTRHLAYRTRLFLDFVIERFESEDYWPGA